MRNSILVLVAAFGVGCAGPKAMSKDDASFAQNGLSVDRPDGWTFVQPDQSLAPDTQIVLQGPVGNEALAPVVEVSRRPLTAMDQRKKPAHLLTALVMEMVQMFDGFDNVTAPADVAIGGIPGSRVDLRFNDVQPDGSTVQRAARFYGVVQGEQMWILRCVGPVNNSQDGAFDAILASVAFQ